MDPRNKKSTRILVVEDAQLPAQVAKMLLEAQGCIVEIAQTGSEAIQHLTHPYDLVLLDLGLPDMNGFDVAQYIRNHPSIQNIPIVALTAHADDTSSLATAKQIGINGLLAKPLTPELCVQLLETFVFSPAKLGYFMQKGDE